MYRIDLDTGECEVFELTSKFRRVQIPSNATFIAEFYLGSSSVEGAGVLVEMWTGTTSFPNGTLDTSMYMWCVCKPVPQTKYAALFDTTFLFSVLDSMWLLLHLHTHDILNSTCAFL